ncbi:diaminopimelate decarboxylase [Gloeobacter violaceus]|uniref:Diaminopimelate decarboxylase n=1 Tax=Gloeobacter violaceus (strain ATCC 29082 / PCC 7421) TaxID=251221 RepID=Q7NPE5_GLOVI|nr:diaminopimelate decarboxylase [Gloeobacter violaceus]BAC88051.1 diaminopimelate decarboxylase [Gloeobacter violaceus PCC 7421]
MPADIPSPNQMIAPLETRTDARGHLMIGGCDVVDLAQRFGTPLYILDEATLRAACTQYVEAFKRHYAGDFRVLYASKAWSNLAICAIVHRCGLGIDAVSAGEVHTALRAGVPGELVYLHGNNKSEAEILLAAEVGATVVADNWLDLEILSAISAECPVRVMVRVAPGIDIHTHEYIRTGHLDSKFGFDPSELAAVLAYLARIPSLRAVGLHAHIGSQSFELAPHGDAAQLLLEWYPKALALGLSDFNELNVGGGLGIRYTDDDDPPAIDEWVGTICQAVTRTCNTYNLPLPKLLCEPGRSLVGPACATAYTVGSTKTIPSIRKYFSVDGGMSDNPRPITYKALYTAVVANKMHDGRREKVTVAGKHCESGDVLLRDVELPPLERGDCLVVFSTGAYNCSMASNYNRIPRPAAVLVSDGEATLIVKRESPDDLLRCDCLPERLQT